MATPQGTNTITSISWPIVLKIFTDGVYGSIPAFYRLNKANKKTYEGGTHIEFGFMVQKFSVGGPYSDYDVLDLTPVDALIRGALDKKQYYKPITLSMRQLSDAQHPDAIANLVVEQATMAKMGMADDLARDLWQSSSSNPKKLDGFRDIVDDGSFNPNYAGLARASYPILQAYVDSTSTTLSFTLIHTLISRATRGAYSPTVGYCRREQWDRLWALAMNFYQVHTDLMLHDNAMFQAGFTSIVVDSVPFIVDDKVFDGPNSSNSAIVVVNENFLSLRVKNDRDFRMEPFRRLEQQDAINAMVFWEGNIVAQAPFTTAKLTNITS